MSKFRTVLTPQSFPFQIGHKDQLMGMGSCFVSNIGQKLETLKFDILTNPFGILYHPIAIAQGLKRLIQNESFSTNELFQQNDLWHSFSHHGQFSHPDKKTCLAKINTSFHSARDRIASTHRLILTFGTAYFFEHTTSAQIVANCHKVPGSEFIRKLASPKKIVQTLSPILDELKTINPTLEVILTVSPIRHIKDGLIENQQSKATLLLAIHHLCRAHTFAHYFPAYEIQMDDLRDYRFYESDLIHPNNMALDYIWEKFSHAIFSEQTIQLNKQIQKVIDASQHRPFHPQSTAHQNFLQQQIRQIEQLQKAHPGLDFTSEQNRFKENLL